MLDICMKWLECLRYSNHINLLVLIVRFSSISEFKRGLEKCPGILKSKIFQIPETVSSGDKVLMNIRDSICHII